MHATTSRSVRVIPALLLAATASLTASAALATPFPTVADVGGACTDETGVTVVVDATELAGDVTVGCATDPATGTEALAQAGFSESRDPSGYICAVGGLPDPCPTEFTGSYWSYWTAAPGGEWTAYAEGSDTAVPAAGTVEGWRYGDGTEPPAVEPADVLPGNPGAGASDEPAEEEVVDAPAEAPAEASAAAEDGAADTEDDAAGDGLSLAVGAAVGIAVVGGLVGLIVRLRRQSRDLAQD